MDRVFRGLAGLLRGILFESNPACLYKRVVDAATESVRPDGGPGGGGLGAAIEEGDVTRDPGPRPQVYRCALLHADTAHCSV